MKMYKLLVSADLYKNKYALLLFNIAFFVIAAILLPIRYEENDDVAMTSILQGVYTFSIPDYHLVCSNALYGYLLKWFYELPVYIEWYALFFSVFHVVSMTVIIWSLVTMKDLNRFCKILFVIIFYVLWLRLIAAFQFTTTSGLLTLAATILILRQQNIGGFVLYMFAVMIRFESAMLVLLLTMPLYAFSFQRNVKRYISVVFLIFLSFGSQYVDRLFYQQSDWKKYEERFKIKLSYGEQIDFSKLKLPPTLSHLDFDLYQHFMDDPNVLTTKKLAQFSDILKDQITFTKRLKYIGQLKKYSKHIVILALCFIFMSLGGRDRRERILPILYFAFWLFVLCYVSMNGKPKQRVFSCFLFVCLYVGMYLFKYRSRNFNYATIGMFSISLLFCTYKTYKYREERMLQYETSWKEQCSLLREVPSNSILYAPGFASQNLPPFSIKTSTTYIPRGLGWMSNIPFNKGIFESHKDIVTHHILIFADKEYTPIWLLQSAISKNYGIKTAKKVYRETEHYALIYLNQNK